MLEGIRERVIVGVVVAIILGALTLLWNWGSSGGLIRVLGGMTEEEIDKRIVAKLGGISAGVPVERVDELERRLFEQEASGVSFIAKGAVIAFDRSESFTMSFAATGSPGGACPPGWRLFREAGGRVIVGAGSHENVDENGASLTRYDAFSDAPDQAVGGTEMHKLIGDEMPEHDHDAGSLQAISDGPMVHGSNVHPQDPKPVNGSERLMLGHLLNRELDHTHGINGKVSPEGKGEPHNNMPPYIALYFCKKEG